MSAHVSVRVETSPVPLGAATEDSLGTHSTTFAVLIEHLLAKTVETLSLTAALSALASRG
ncbi:MAG: hypothetical protein WCC60_04605 [Ilumatobacteraceae bacterium]